MNNIYLVGFMATGKTSVGSELASQQKRQFIDLDDLIESREKRRISEIFAKEGEAYFRKREKDALQEASCKDETVVACGGGIVIDPDNVRLMKETGIIICLDAKLEVILKRSAGYSHRPLLNVSDPKKQIESLLKTRAPFYALADNTIDTSKITIKETVDKILKTLPKKK